MRKYAKMHFTCYFIDLSHRPCGSVVFIQPMEGCSWAQPTEHEIHVHFSIRLMHMCSFLKLLVKGIMSCQCKEVFLNYIKTNIHSLKIPLVELSLYSKHCNKCWGQQEWSHCPAMTSARALKFFLTILF
jgi:hypothetical protein